MNELKSAASSLARINKAGGDNGESWRDNLTTNCSWKKVVECWEQKLSRCDAERIENELEKLKEELFFDLLLHVQRVWLRMLCGALTYLICTSCVCERAIDLRTSRPGSRTTKCTTTLSRRRRASQR